MERPTIGKTFRLVDTYIEGGQLWYAVEVNTSCCKGQYDYCFRDDVVWCKQTGMKASRGVVAMLEEEIRNFKK